MTPEVLTDDPFWMTLIKVVAIFALLQVLTLFMIWFERRVVGRMQHRPGPNRVGKFGLLQSAADGLKLALKEDIMPVMADKKIYFLAPVISAIPAFVAFSVVPLGGEVSIFGEDTLLQLVDLNVGVLVVLACSSLGVYGIVLAGWSSGSPYPLLSALRSAAQVISYEIALGLSIVGVIIYAESLSTREIVEAQAEQSWYILLLLPSFLVFIVAMVGETNRAPFDLPEAESELVGGFHTEYSSLKFALFFLAEYVNIITVSSMCTTLFLGGWKAPWPISELDDGRFNQGWWGLIWFFSKLLIVLFFFVWLRGTLPRLRYDQFMNLGWKVLVPVSLVWIVLVAGAKALKDEDVSDREYLIAGGVVLGLIILGSLLIPERKPKPEGPDEPELASDYPVPPLDLVVPPVPPRRGALAGSRPPERGEIDYQANPRGPEEESSHGSA